MSVKKHLLQIPVLFIFICINFIIPTCKYDVTFSVFIASHVTFCAQLNGHHFSTTEFYLTHNKIHNEEVPQALILINITIQIIMVMLPH